MLSASGGARGCSRERAVHTDREAQRRGLGGPLMLIAGCRYRCQDSSVKDSCYF